MKKQCCTCHREKRFDLFSRRSDKPHLYRSQCKACACSKSRRRRGLLGSMELNLKTRFGLTVDQRRKMIEKQNSLCAICGDFLLRPCIDHSHQTGKIRGILCQKCNSGLGMFRDSVVYLSAAIRYLELSI